tara:strand:+ start:5743 stop:6654 length:912 start_codon:yes stop_codon:yes gene_type:complete
MLVTFAGCGALGSLLASRFIDAGHDVQVFQRPGAQFDALAANGITIEADGQRSAFPLAAVSSDAAKLAPSRLIIVLVKAYSTAEIEGARDVLSPDGIALTLQNGLGPADVLAGIFGDERSAAGITTIGSYTITPGVTGLGGWGDTVIGPWQSGTDISWIAEAFEDSGIPVELEDDPRPAIWRKLAINAMVNPLTALTGLRVGEARDRPALIDMMQRLGREAVTAAQRAGVKLDFDSIWEQNSRNLVRTAANKTSMLQDIEAGRKTEIDAISGSVLKYAESEIDFPYTRTIYSLLKSIDDSRGH